MTENTRAWEKYQHGMDYQSKISLLPKIDKNERFYSGDHWRGVKANKLPTPILNVTKRIIDWKVAQVMSDLLKMQFAAEGISDTAEDERSKTYRDIAKKFSDYATTKWEHLKMDSMNEKGLLKATQACSMISYWYWYDKIDNGDGQMGDFMGELVNSCNYFPGDPNTPEINNAYEPVQPYIILSFRRNVSDIRREAEENGVKKEEIELISADDETKNQAGDRAKTELDGDDGKCIVLLHMWRELVEEYDETEQKTIDSVTGMTVAETVKVPKGKAWHILAEKSTRQVVIRKKWDTGLHRYPVALMNWYEREGDAYGEAEATSLVPNNIMINQQAAMIALWIKLHGFPKVLYDKTRIPNWTNDLSSAIPVNGVDAGGVGGAAQYMQPAQISAAVMKFMEWFISITKDMAGANESALGEANPTNTSAIVVNSKNAVVPLASIKRRFYQYVEDVGLIWLDFFTSKYTDYPVRNLSVKQDNKTVIEPIDTSVMKDIKLKLKIEVGPANQWNEAAQIQTLDNLLQRQLITFIEYLERQPKGVIPGLDELLESRKSAETQQQARDRQFMYEMMAREMERIEPMLPPETQNQLKLLQRNDPANYEAQVRQLIQEAGQQTPTRPYGENAGVM
jgi:hypothetical protein